MSIVELSQLTANAPTGGESISKIQSKEHPQLHHAADDYSNVKGSKPTSADPESSPTTGPAFNTRGALKKVGPMVFEWLPGR